MIGRLRARFGHWTPRYVWDRSLVAVSQRLHPDWPWLTRDAVLLLESLLRREDVGLELGSGRSTVWFAKRVARLVSVEDNREWYEKVQAMLRREGLSNVDYRFAQGKAAYVGEVAALPRESFDFALVDGSHRDEVLQQVVGVVRPGGLVIVDNVNWYVPTGSRSPTSARDGKYAPGLWEELFEQRLRGWRRIWTSNGVTDTVILFKPAGGS